MIFADAKPDMKARIVSRAWQAIKLDVREMPDEAVDELMAEWISGLFDLHIDEIALGVKACQREGKTAPIDEFVLMCRPAREEKQPPAMTGPDGTETREQSYYNLKLDQRWGSLP